MIAEKTADAIKGRKLAPFEPPTRIAAHLYGPIGPKYGSVAPPVVYKPFNARPSAAHMQPAPLPPPPPHPEPPILNAVDYSPDQFMSRATQIVDFINFANLTGASDSNSLLYNNEALDSSQVRLQEEEEAPNARAS